MRRIAIILFSITGLVSIDFLSKQYIQNLFSNWTHEYFPILGEYFGVSLSYNSGIAFSLPITGIPLQIITLLLSIGIIYYYFHIEFPKNIRFLDIWYSLILAWAISHAYERIFIGHVIDFISVKYFAILNFADIFISIGACFILFVYYVRK